MQSETGKADFNDAIGYLSRINACYFLCNKARGELDGDTWFHALNSLHAELSTYMDEAMKVKRHQQMQKINKLLTDWRESEDADMPSELYYELFDYELSLRDLYKKTGLQMKEKDDATKGLR